MNPTFSYQPYQLYSNSNDNSMMSDMQMQMPLSLPHPMARHSMSIHDAMTNSSYSFQIDDFVETNDPFNAASYKDASLSQFSAPRANLVPNDSASSSAESSVPSFVAERKLLGPDFCPGPYDVICARGAAAANHDGNLRFRKTVQDFVPQYSKATTKLEKSLLVSAIVDSVRDYAPDGGFVKKFEDGNWYEVGDACAREKIGQTLRDALHQKYKSSTRAKKPRRKELKEIKKKKPQGTPKTKKAKTSKATKLSLVATESLSAMLMVPPLVGQDEQQDDNELSLTSIFSNALAEGLNLDSILRC
jgi:hypothetical protein